MARRCYNSRGLQAGPEALTAFGIHGCGDSGRRGGGL